MTATSRMRSTERPGRPFSDPDRDSRVQLLSAATDLFAQQGVAATSFSAIARRAGLTPAMVHYHFRNRDQLLDAVVEERLVPFLHYVWDPVRPGEHSRNLIRGLVQRLLEQIELAPWVPSTWMREILNEGGLLRGRMVPRLPFDKVRIVAQAVASEQATRDVNSYVDPLLIVFSMLGLVMVHSATTRVWAEVFGRPTPDTVTMQRHITALLLNGLSPEPKLTQEAISTS